MKTLQTIVLLTMLSTTIILGQTKAYTDKIPNVSFCNAVKLNDTIRYSDLVKCDEVLQPYKELKIKSFTFSFLVPPADGIGDGLFMDYANTGSKLNKPILDVLKTLEAKKVKKLFRYIRLERIFNSLILGV